MFFAHVTGSGDRLHQHIPFPLDVLGAKYEYLIMKLLGIMTNTDWLYRYKATRWFVDKLANRIIIPIIHGEVVTPDEIEALLFQLEKEGHPISLGICECRHGENHYTDEVVEGVDPNYTCVMIGDWGKGHLYSYPELLQAHQRRGIVQDHPLLAPAGAGAQRLGHQHRPRLRHLLLPLPARVLRAAAPPVQARGRGLQARLPLRHGRRGEMRGAGEMRVQLLHPLLVQRHRRARRQGGDKHHAVPWLRPVLRVLPLRRGRAVRKKDFQLAYCSDDLLHPEARN